MTHRPVSLHAPRGSVTAAEIRTGIDALLEKYGADLPITFPAEVLSAAEQAAGRASGAAVQERKDLTGIPFVTLDPVSSTDLDQAMHLERRGDGYRILYAIADVPHFVDLNGAIDREARRRGTTVYLPDRRIPLHPEILSEAAASLLPDQVTPAFVWDLTLDAEGRLTAIGLERALVRSVEKLDYDSVQEALDAGTGHPTMVLLQEIGALRARQEAERGGASLNVPEQEVIADNGLVRLSWRSVNPVEDANAQLSLLTGMAAAQLMLEHGSGILRTMPPADPRAVERFRRQAEVLGVPWAQDVAYGQFLRSLNWREPKHLALLNQATSLFRGASYAAFTSAKEIPEDPEQAAIAAPYAHTTAPLRRLVDRFVLLVCHAHAQGRPPAPELLEALTAIPEAMQRSAGKAGDLERRAIELVETAALAAWVGAEFTATVIERREATPGTGGTSNGSNGGTGNNGSDGSNGSNGDRATANTGNGAPTRVEVQLTDPPVTAWVAMDAQIADEVRVRLESVDPLARRAVFVPVGEA